MPSKKPEEPTDWRTLPRKPADQLRSGSISIKVTQAELKRIKANAEKAGKTLRDWIVKRAG